MNRRNFLKNTVYTSSMMGATLGFTLPSTSAEASTPALTDRVLVNVMLLGGADLRYLLVPAPGSAYADKFWEKRKALYTDITYATYDDCFNDLYDPVESNGTAFGIHKKAGWLKEQFDVGNVAIVANVFGSKNRRHDHSQLIVNSGDPAADQYTYDREGWGGRFVDSVGAVTGVSANAVPVSHAVPIYCNGFNAGNRLEKVVHVKNSRKFALPTGNSNPISHQSILGRALKVYYKGRKAEVDKMIASGTIPEDWPYRKFFNHESAIREFGDAFEERLQQVQPNRPYLLTRLYDTSNNSIRRYNLYRRDFGSQLANLFDCMRGTDILQLRTAYMEYGGWDNHRRLQYYFERNIEDIFGKTVYSPEIRSGGLDNFTVALDQSIPGANENIVYVFNSDFGRQLAANGDSGTDHGVGSYSLVVGRGVQGGVHGEMFPQSEIADLGGGITRFDKQGADIEGRTSFEHIMGAACDWVEQGTSSNVFPNLSAITKPPLETGVDPATLFEPGFAIAGEMTGTTFLWVAPPLIIRAEKQDSAVVKDQLIKSNRHYWLDGLSDGTYQVSAVISPAYFSVDTPAQSVVLAGDNVSGIDFQVTPKLHTAINYKYQSMSIIDNGDGTFTRVPIIAMYLFGYNFTVGETQVTIDGHPCTVSGSSGYISVGGIPDGATGNIVITTGTETYTQPTAFEDVPLGVWFNAYV